MNNVNIIKKSKELRYVTVYNVLYKKITEGIFPINSQLPSEPELAKELNVSRSTLRQALTFLQDDGLIKNIRGKGNFILNTNTSKCIGIETMGKVVHKSIDGQIDDIELDFDIVPPSDYFTDVLKSKPVAVVSIDRWYKSGDRALAYSFTILPIETVSTYNIELDNLDSLLNFLEEDIYNICSNTDISIKFSHSGKFATKKYSISNQNNYFLIEEYIYINNLKPIAFTKYYLPVDNSSIKVQPTK